ncbi:phosphatase PAP2 family protein [Vibrio sp.]|uniref:phosphatase PAP2 family protein n=1 Tax=Vibrio sp. TaxID=678 RepID=UPI003D0F6C38
MRVIDSIVKLDLAFSGLCLHHRHSMRMAQLSRAISHTGDGHLYLLMGLMAWATGGGRGLAFLTAGLVAFAIELPFYWLIKNGFKRRRPEELSSQLRAYIKPSDRYSLPSGHTAAGFVMAILIGHFYPLMGGLALVWAVLIGTSRILLGVHFLTDVVLGAALGMASALVALQLTGA